MKNIFVLQWHCVMHFIIILIENDFIIMGLLSSELS